MTNEQNQIKKIAFYTFLGIVFWVIVGLIYFNGCNPPTSIPQNSALESKKAVSEYKRKLLTDKLNVLQKFDTIYVTRWKRTKAETKVIVDSILVMAPDTCTPYIRIIENRLVAERQVADSSLAVKDSINQSLRQIAVEDSVQKSILASQLNNSRDSIPQAKRKGFVKGFLWGFGTASVINQGINIINKVK